MLGGEGLAGCWTCKWSMDWHLLETMTSACCPRPAPAKSRGPREHVRLARQPSLLFHKLAKSHLLFLSRSLICLLSSIHSGMLLRPQWPCRRLHHNAKSLASITARSFASSTPCRNDLATSKTRNIGIIAHIDAVCRDIYSFKM